MHKLPAAVAGCLSLGRVGLPGSLNRGYLLEVIRAAVVLGGVPCRRLGVGFHPGAWGVRCLLASGKAALGSP